MKKNIIFLDIDGVLQHPNSKERFKHNLETLQLQLAQRYNDSNFEKIDKYDIGACYFDWDKKAVSLLKKFLDENNGYIVLHSNWREYLTLSTCKSLFKIHNLDKYVIACLEKGNKEDVIINYLNNNQININTHCVIDDKDMRKTFGPNQILTKSLLEEKDIKTATVLFNNDINFLINDTNITVLFNKKAILKLNYYPQELNNNLILELFIEYIEPSIDISIKDIILNYLIYIANINNINILIINDNIFEKQSTIIDNKYIYNISLNYHSLLNLINKLKYTNPTQKTLKKRITTS